MKNKLTKTTIKQLTFAGLGRTVFASLFLICITGGALGRPSPAERAAVGGGNTGGGTIYYLGPWDGATHNTAVMRAMNSDGTNNTQLGFGPQGNPSIALHGGHRWFLINQSIPGVYNPDGTQRFELFAMRDDDDNQNNNPVTRVQLTYDIDLQVQAGRNWLLGDQTISFEARRWSGGVVVEGGIYMASPVFDADGNITGLAAQPTTPAISFPLVEITPGDLWADLNEYSWAPAGDRVIYTRVGDRDLTVADLLGSLHLRIFTGSARNPQWSPDGTKIAFSSGGSISTIKPNGTQRKVIVAALQNWTFYWGAYWSPGGTHIAYTGQQIIGSNSNLDVFRATATGTGRTNLTNQPYPFNEFIAFGHGGWR